MNKIQMKEKNVQKINYRFRFISELLVFIIGKLGRNAKANSESVNPISVDSDKGECGMLPSTYNVLQGSRDVSRIAKAVISTPHELVCPMTTLLDKNTNANTDGNVNANHIATVVRKEN